MTTIEDRVMALEVRVDHLETWAGPGQVEALSTSLAALRADLTSFRREMRADLGAVKADLADFRREMDIELGTLKSDVSTLKSDVSTLKSDVSTLKSDMTEVKHQIARMGDTLIEVLRRLPAVPTDN